MIHARARPRIVLVRRLTWGRNPRAASRMRRWTPITHLFLGGAITAAIAPARHRRAALLAGAALNTLPDLDVLPLALCDDPVARMTWHRSATHSWLVLPFVAWLLWLYFRARGGRVGGSAAALVVGDLPVPAGASIDRCVHRVRHAAVLAAADAAADVVEPVHHRSVVHLAVVAGVRGRLVRARAALRPARARSQASHCGVAYVGLSLLAKAHGRSRGAIARSRRWALQDAPRFSVPTPFNTLLWRVVAMTPDGYRRR